MMRVLLDTNVVLDALLYREPWVAQARAIWEANRTGLLEGCVPSSILTDVYYISHRLVGNERARQAVRECLDRLTLLSVDYTLLEEAYRLAVADFEDAVQIACARRHGLDAIVTRDTAGFAGAQIPVLRPEELVARLRNGEDT